MNNNSMSPSRRIFTFVRDYRNTSLYTSVMVTIILLLEVLERFQ